MNHPRPSDFTVAKLIDEFALCRWVGMAVSGSAIEYYRGDLARDRTTHGKFGDTPERRALIAIANRALDLSGRGLVRLFQRRYGPHDYGYVCIVSSPRRETRPAKPTFQSRALGRHLTQHCEKCS